MQRRRFVQSALSAAAAAAGLVAASEPSSAQTPAGAGAGREYYLIRRFHLQSGPQVKLTEDYFSGALIPALNRLGIAPVGAFKIDIGPETPTFVLLVPSSDLTTLVTVDSRLMQDEAFVTAARPYWNIPAVTPAYWRIDSTLHIAFPSWPRLIVPKTADRAKQIFQMRTYESATYQDHVRKVEMMMNGESKIFEDAGFDQVFFGDTLIGPREPSLTYMVSVPDLAHLNPSWEAFRSHPDWKKLTADPRYSFETIVSSITNLILLPLACSQI